MIKIRASHKLHNIVFQISDTEAMWAVISECLKRLHIHYGLILKETAGLKIEVLEIQEGEPRKPRTINKQEGL